jgi:GT2 family glycosyltransferase
VLFLIILDDPLTRKKVFSIIIPIIDPFDRFVTAGAIQSTLGKALALEGDFELIVVNNNPVSVCPQLTQYLRSLTRPNSEKVKVLEPGLNLGTARGFNAGLRAAQPQSQYLVFMSSDADIVDLLMLKKIQLTMDNNPNIGIAHPISVYEDSNAFNFSSRYSIQAFRRMIRQQYSLESADIPDRELQYILKVVSGRRGTKSPFPGTPLTFAVHRRTTLDCVGSFDEGVEWGCYEVSDLGLRTLLSGYDVARLNDVFVNHRRPYIRSLVVGGTPESLRLPHMDVIGQSAAWWNKKWGRPYTEIYAKWRYGSLLFTFMLPYFWARRLGGFLKRTVAYRQISG